MCGFVICLVVGFCVEYIIVEFVFGFKKSIAFLFRSTNTFFIFIFLVLRQAKIDSQSISYTCVQRDGFSLYKKILIQSYIYIYYVYIGVVCVCVCC